MRKLHRRRAVFDDSFEMQVPPGSEGFRQRHRDVIGQDIATILHGRREETGISAFVGMCLDEQHTNVRSERIGVDSLIPKFGTAPADNENGAELIAKGQEVHQHRLHGVFLVDWD